MLKIAKAVQAASAACRSLTGGDGATHNNSLLGSILSATMIFSATIIHLPFYRSAQQSHNKPTVVRDTRQKTKEIALFHCQSNEESTDAVSKKNQACWSKNVIQEQWSCHFGLKWYQTHMGERSKQSKPNYGDTTRSKPCQPFWDKAQGNWPEGREGTHRTLLLGATYTHYSKASQLCLSLQVLLVTMIIWCSRVMVVLVMLSEGAQCPFVTVNALAFLQLVLKTAGRLLIHVKSKGVSSSGIKGRKRPK